MIRNRILFHVIRIFIGCVFILSAILKLLSVDVFELYIYSIGLFGFNLSAIAARLIISTEFILGVLLVVGIYYRKVFAITCILIAAFSVFLLIRIIKGATGENCNCFGNYLQMTPGESLIKNVILLFLLFLIRNHQGISFRFQKWTAIVICLVFLALPPVYSAPDFLYNREYPEVDIARSGELIRTNEKLHNLHIDEGKKLVCFFSVTCSHCENAAKKISIMSNANGIADKTFYVFTGEEKNLPEFWEKSGSDHLPYAFLPLSSFFKIAGPSVPSIYLLKNGEVIAHFHNADIDEKEIADFFK